MLTNGTNGARSGTQLSSLSLLLVCYRPLAQLDLVPEPQHASGGIRKVSQPPLLHFNGVLQPGSLRAVPSHTLSWSAHNL